MGHCSSIAMGIAISKPTSQVVCVDGDGAALMHMGSMPLVGNSGLTNLKHILVNNGMHDSVGGQPTEGFEMDWAKIARGSGYASAKSVSSHADIQAALKELETAPGPAFLEIKALPGARADLGRPTASAKANKEGFMNKLV